MAIGLSPRQAVWLVIGDGAALLACGIVFGLIGAALAAQCLRSMRYGVGPADPLTYVGAAVMTSVIGLLACYVPARRAAGIDPLHLLRSE